MAIAAGTRLGPYEIVAPLGAGGMGEVYKARDTRLDRLVAIKILPAALAADPQLRDRFEREAKAVAAISHPNILALHDVGHAGDVTFAVMELLDGETLRDRLKAAVPNGLPVRKAIDYALQVARGLAAAHEKGIVHRDLKPENILITSDGRAKILDFGLAKQRVDGAPLATMTPTCAGGTTPGTILGTIGYMAPEQVRGLDVDHRADIFAFGAVVYEMVAGRSAFQRDTTADTISAILHNEPRELTELDPSLPPALDRIVRRCLEKSAAERFHSAHDVAFALEMASGDRGSSSIMTSPNAGIAVASKRWRLLAASAALIVLGAVVGGGIALSIRRDGTAPQRFHLAVLPPAKVAVVDALALSPDGKSVAFVGVDENAVAHLWIRRFAEQEARALPDSDAAAFPFWSPDGKSLAFFAQGRLKRIELAGGPSRVLASVAAPRGGTWNNDGVIVFAPNSGDGLYRVSAEGGPVTRLTTLDTGRREVSHRWPMFLPDGRHIIFVNRSPNPDERLAIYVTSLDAPDAQHMRKLAGSDSPATYSNGRLFYVRGTTVFAQPFDLSRLLFSGEMTAVLEHVMVDHDMDGLVAFSVVGDVIAARTAENAGSQLMWFDRSGRALNAIGPMGAGDPEISPDGRFVGFDLSEAGNAGAKKGLWTADLDRGTMTRLGPTSPNDVMPTWSPDGKRIMFSSDRSGSFDLYEKAIGPAPEREVLRSNLWKYPESWSPDGRTLLFSQLDPKSRTDLWLLPLDAGRPTLFLGTDAEETQGRFSPDGRFVAYVSTESGRAEVYVRTYPASDAQWQISIDGGANPLWRRDGREIFFLSPDNRVMSAVVRDHTATFDAAVPTALFRVQTIRRDVGGVLGGDRYYAVTERGDRFLINQVTSDVRASAITVSLEGRK
jgi:Tol biopolymer transport system component